MGLPAAQRTTRPAGALVKLNTQRKQVTGLALLPLVLYLTQDTRQMESLHLRQADYHFVLDCIKKGESCSIIGLSNTGKSTLLRDLAAGTNHQPQIFVHVDCNLMLAATDQGFYEAVLRALKETLEHQEAPATLLENLATCYRQTVQAGSAFMVPLGFNDAIMHACQTLPGGIVLLLDEFDEAYAALNSRVFLNLRALHDKYRPRLNYVTGTIMPLCQIQSGVTIDEFYELVRHNERHLSMLDAPDATALLLSMAAQRAIKLDEAEIGFVWQQAGGHPGLTVATAQLLIELEAGAPELYRQQGLDLVAQQLDENEIAHSECFKLWNQLTEQERDRLFQLVIDEEIDPSSPVYASLVQKGILAAGEKPCLFGERFAAFVRRRRRAELDYPEGIWIDVDAGDVWVDSMPVATLTELEYRLLQTLYGRMEKLCDKYLIVESVWGQEYIDTVDDARIEKLISRLRSKIEPDPSNPRYLVTVRGRGYKLVQHPVYD